MDGDNIDMYCERGIEEAVELNVIHSIDVAGDVLQSIVEDL